MARRGFGGTALRAALGAVTGVAEGMRVREEREFERQKAEEALNYQRQRDLLSDARQREQAAAQLRSEERQAAAAGMIGASQYTGLSPFDMPGATPREPVLRQMIGGREMVLPEAKPVAEHRAEVTKALAERQKKQAEGTALRTALANVEIGGKKLGEEQAAALQMLDPNSRSIVLGARRDAARPQRVAGGGKEELPDWKKREMGAEFLSSQTFNPALTKALQTRFARDPNAAQDPEMVAYELMVNKTVKPITPLQRYKPPVEKKEGAGTLADKIVEQVRAAREGKGKPETPPAAPTPAPAPAAPPASRSAPAAPAAPPQVPANLLVPQGAQGPRGQSFVDQALEQDRKLWDEAVAKHGRERVLAEFGPRP